MTITKRVRRHFDGQLERVLAELPPRVSELLKSVPLVVEDHPSPKMMRSLGETRDDELCGLYTGVPLIERSVEHSGQPTDVIHLFRVGIIAAARDENGELTDEELRGQIRITILHEFGHYHGLDERELEDLGY